MKSRLGPAVALLAVSSGGCASAGIERTDDQAAAEGGRTGNATSHAGEPSCPSGPGHDSQTDPQLVTAVSALLVDQDEQPMADQPVQVCGIDLCVFGETSQTGQVRMTPGERMRSPAFKYGEGKTTAKFAWLLPDQPIVDLKAVRGVRLPDLDRGVPLLAGAEANSHGLSLLPTPKADIRFDGIVFRTEAERRLRAVPIPIDTAPAVVDPDLEFEMLYATTPVDTVFCPPALMRVENSPGWSPQTEIEVWLHGTDIAETWAPYGGWAKISSARVSRDGTTVETTDPGLPVLGVLGFRRP